MEIEKESSRQRKILKSVNDNVNENDKNSKYGNEIETRKFLTKT